MSTARYFAGQLVKSWRDRGSSLLPYMIRPNFHKRLPTWISSQIWLIGGKPECILFPWILLLNCIFLNTRSQRKWLNISLCFRACLTLRLKSYMKTHVVYFGRKKKYWKPENIGFASILRIAELFVLSRMREKMEGTSLGDN